MQKAVDAHIGHLGVNGNRHQAKADRRAPNGNNNSSKILITLYQRTSPLRCLDPVVVQNHSYPFPAPYIASIRASLREDPRSIISLTQRLSHKLQPSLLHH